MELGDGAMREKGEKLSHDGMVAHMNFADRRQLVHIWG
jgi:hypothetical protein